MAIMGGGPASAAAAAAVTLATVAAREREPRAQSDLEAWRSLLSIFSNYSTVLDEWVRPSRLVQLQNTTL